ncbi:MAG: Histidine-tRNA ligase [candidate division Kazan bacterium GW2011_GWA1_44_22]|uniref:Histidine--tRNA ligase n=1 Tax=candidate division Kazan bacterium GW2011_GWA1_44_22 TaxID=1620410 RepID=A0A0G1KW75_UNCK3|nr:MAG: Histidine-tRNA ligase [candidate division Kazan bacterium GW2011_GWA1_44_22]
MSSSKTIQIPRGLKDILPDEQKYWFWLEKNFQDVAHLSGFERIILPAFEATELFKRSVGEFTDIVTKQMYTFKDLGGNSVTLRPEGTAGVVRAYLEHGMKVLPQPVKLYYWGPMYRYERPQSGRYREFYQFGMEMIGDMDPLTDALLIQSAARYYQKVGLKNLLVKINSLGTPKSRVKVVAVLEKYLSIHKKDLCPDCKLRLKKNVLRVLDCKVAKCKEITSETGHLIIDNLDTESKKRFTKVLEHLDEMKVPYELAPNLVRGLDYYTHTIFEIVTADDDTALGGGGRYDGLIKLLGGADTPAVGYAGGVERTIDALKKQEVLIPEMAKTDIFVVQLGERAKSKVVDLISQLEQIGLRVSSLMGKESIQTQLKAASDLNSPIALIIGDQEVHDRNVIMRDMHDRAQETVIDRNVVKMVMQKLEKKI